MMRGDGGCIIIKRWMRLIKISMDKVPESLRNDVEK